MKTTEQTLLIVDNDPEFKKHFDQFKETVLQYVERGFAYNGMPLSIGHLNKNGAPSIVPCHLENGHSINFRNDLPMALFNNGFRVDQFGMFFVAENALSFSHGTMAYAAFKGKISASLRRNGGYNESLQHDETATAIALIGRIVKPVA